MWRVLNGAITKVYDVMHNVVGVTLMAFETLDPYVPVAMLGYMLHEDIVHLTVWHKANSAQLFIKSADHAEVNMAMWLQQPSQFQAVTVDPVAEKLAVHDVNSVSFDDLAEQFANNPYRMLATPVADGVTATSLVTLLRQWRGMLPDIFWDEEILAESPEHINLAPAKRNRLPWKEMVASEMAHATPGCTCHVDFTVLQCFENHRTCSTCVLRLVQVHVNMLREALQDPYGCCDLAFPRLTCPHNDCKQIFTTHWLTTKAVELDVDLLKSIATLQGLQKQMAVYQQSSSLLSPCQSA